MFVFIYLISSILCDPFSCLYYLGNNCKIIVYMMCQLEGSFLASFQVVIMSLTNNIFKENCPNIKKELCYQMNYDIYQYYIYQPNLHQFHLPSSLSYTTSQTQTHRSFKITSPFLGYTTGITTAVELSFGSLHSVYNFQI